MWRTWKAQQQPIHILPWCNVLRKWSQNTALRCWIYRMVRVSEFWFSYTQRTPPETFGNILSYCHHCNGYLCRHRWLSFMYSGQKMGSGNPGVWNWTGIFRPTEASAHSLLPHNLHRVMCWNFPIMSAMYWLNLRVVDGGIFCKQRLIW